jgi:hypothetical protein
MEYIYFIHLILVILMLFFSFKRFKSVLHPHFVFTFIFLYSLYADFLIRGYIFESKNIYNSSFYGISSENLVLYQLLILMMVIIVYLFSYYINLGFKSVNTRYCIQQSSLITKKTLLTAIGIIIILLDLTKRLYFSDWSFSNLLLNSLLSYGSKPWASSGGFIGDSKFIFTLTNSMLPIASMTFGMLFIKERGVKRYLFFFLMIIPLLLLMSNGARTPIALVLGSLALLSFYSVNGFTRLVVIIKYLSIVVILFSFLYGFRADGFPSSLQDPIFEKFEISYSQDDNYYRTINAMHISEGGEESWDPVHFFYTIAVNPIPRYFWNDKPKLQADYYGKYKWEWVTIGFIGEFVAMFGIYLGVFVSAIYAMLASLGIRLISQFLFKRAGFFLYLVLVLYVYMLFRSVMNITMYMYMPLFALILYFLLHYKVLWGTKK